MKQIVVISGKGGTGKTSVTASFIQCAGTSVHCDCDVDAADLHLVVAPQKGTEEIYYGLQAAVIDKNLCTDCGKCREACRFDAIEDNTVKTIRCEGCGVCVYVCPQKAISMEDRAVGTVGVSKDPYGILVAGRLYPAAGNSGKMVSQLRSMAHTEAKKMGAEYIIIDGSPGIGCAVIASMANTDMAAIVTEPTLSGLHDLDRVIDVAKHFSIPIRVIINKADIHPGNAQLIEELCQQKNIAVLGKIPYDASVTSAMVAAEPLTLYGTSKAAEEIRTIWKKLIAEL